MILKLKRASRTLLQSYGLSILIGTQAILVIKYLSIPPALMVSHSDDEDTPWLRQGWDNKQFTWAALAPSGGGGSSGRQENLRSNMHRWRWVSRERKSS